MKTHDFEFVRTRDADDDDNFTSFAGDCVRRLRVPGGWIYRMEGEVRKIEWDDNERCYTAEPVYANRDADPLINPTYIFVPEVSDEEREESLARYNRNHPTS